MRTLRHKAGRLSRMPLVQLAAGAILIGFSAVFVKSVEGTSGPFATAFWRMLFGGLVLVLVGGGRGRSWKISGRDSGLIVLAGITFALDLGLWHSSIHRVGPGLATILGNLQVILLAVIGWLCYREIRARRVLASVALALPGLALLCLSGAQGGNGEYQAGVAYGLVAACCYTVYIIVLKALAHDGTGSARLDARQLMILICFASALILAGLAVASGESLVLPDWQTTLVLLGNGILCQAIAWVWIAGAIGPVEVAVAGLLLLLQPAVSMLGDIVFFGRSASVPEIVGAALAFAGIYAGAAAPRR